MSQLQMDCSNGILLQLFRDFVFVFIYVLDQQMQYESEFIAFDEIHHQ
jgi:hypothetical protein